jgi:molecular chaperone GrpE
VELVRDQFLAKLQGLGVARLTVLGRPFDARHDEAVTTTPVDNPSEDGIIVAVIREGYTIGDDLLRPASVVVGRSAKSPES